MTRTSNPPAHARRVCLLAQPRTASHLLTKMLGLEKQEHVHWDEDRLPSSLKPYMAISGMLDKAPGSEWSDKELQEARLAFQECHDNLNEYIASGEADGKTVIFLKEHGNQLCDPTLRFPEHQQLPGGRKRFNVTSSLPETIDNPTVFPSAFLEAWTPIFLIRHPALVFPSFCRASSKLLGVFMPDNGPAGKRFREKMWIAMSFSETRELYDWYTDYQEACGDQNNAILLDAHDFILHPNIAQKVAEAIGLDKSKVQQTWSPNTNNMTPVHQAFRQTVRNSTGIEKERAPEHIDTAKEAVKWKEEFGAVGAALIASCVKAAMPDYEYLRTKRTWVD